jgi:hypothetical protein
VLRCCQPISVVLLPATERYTAASYKVLHCCKPRLELLCNHLP